VSRFTRLAAYGVVLALSFAGGVLAGGTAGPDATTAPEGHRMEQAETTPAEHGAEGPAHGNEH
jgi:hypothetical protein